MAQLRFTQTIRNRPVMITPTGYAYARNRQSTNLTTEFWRCELRSKCPGRAITRNIRVHFEETTEHNHLLDPIR